LGKLGVGDELLSINGQSVGSGGGETSLEEVNAIVDKAAANRAELYVVVKKGGAPTNKIAPGPASGRQSKPTTGASMLVGRLPLGDSSMDGSIEVGRFSKFSVDTYRSPQYVNTYRRWNWDATRRRTRWGFPSLVA
jgi:hypothetical protein